MTQAQTKDQDAAHKATPQLHHQKAAEQHELAAKHHKEAAKRTTDMDSRVGIVRHPGPNGLPVSHSDLGWKALILRSDGTATPFR